MQNHFQLNDNEFEIQFENCVLDPKLFNHEAHIRLAWVHIKKYGIEKAIVNVDRQLLRFIESLGVKDKYNKTVTIAAVKTVYHFVLKSKTNNFKAFITEFPRLKENFKELLDSHYSIDLFNSKLAKKEYINSDVLPFD